MLMLILLSLSPSPLMVEGAVVCPSAADYAPCECSEYIYQPGTVFLGCSSKQLTDSRASDILDVFLTTPGVSPLVYLDLQYNQLTREPSQIKSFPQLERVYLLSMPLYKTRGQSRLPQCTRGRHVVMCCGDDLLVTMHRLSLCYL